VQIGNVALRHLADQIQIFRFFVFVIGGKIIERIEWRNTYANTTGTYFCRHCIKYFQQITTAIFRRAAVFIVPYIAARIQKLAEQIAIGRVQFDTIKTGRRLVLRRETPFWQSPNPTLSCAR